MTFTEIVNKYWAQGNEEYSKVVHVCAMKVWWGMKA
jgi:hypothetical protein